MIESEPNKFKPQRAQRSQRTRKRALSSNLLNFTFRSWTILMRGPCRSMRKPWISIHKIPQV